MNIRVSELKALTLIFKWDFNAFFAENVILEVLIIHFCSKQGNIK